MSTSDTTLSWDEAMSAARRYVREHAPELERLAVVGSTLRRKAEVHDVDLLVIPAPNMLAFPKPPPPLNVFVTTRQCWEPALLQYAPSVGSVVGARYRAKQLGFKLNQYGLWDLRLDESEEPVSRSAGEIYALIGATPSQWVQRSLGGDLVLCE